MNSGRPISFATAFAMSWNCGDDGLLAKLGSTPRSVSRNVWMHDRVEGDLLRRLRREVLPEGDDAVLDRRAVALRPLEQPEPGERGGERAARGSAQADDLEAILNAAREQRLQRARDERALASTSLTRDRDAFAAHGFAASDVRTAAGASMNANLGHCLIECCPVILARIRPRAALAGRRV